MAIYHRNFLPTNSNYGITEKMERNEVWKNSVWGVPFKSGLSGTRKEKSRKLWK